MKKPIVFLLLAFMASFIFAYEPVYTTIQGVLQKQGKPLSGAMIISCEDFYNFGSKPCERPVKVFTDKQGNFSFSVQTGYPPCTVCPCLKGIPSVCDPGMGFWFDVIAGNDSREFLWMGFGSGIAGGIQLKCDVQPTGSKPELRLIARGTRKYLLPELNC